MTRPNAKSSGFTLIELLIVVVILSTLAAIVVPQFASSSDTAKLAAAKSSLGGIRSAISIYKADKGSYPLEEDLSYCTGFGGVEDGGDTMNLFNTLAYYSNSSGQICDAKSDDHPQGPYLRANAFPTNPIVNTNTVSKSTASVLGVGADSSGTAWLYQPATGEFIINDSAHEKF